MPRSFSFDPFTAKQVEVDRDISHMEKQEVTEQDPLAELPNQGIHYGREHSETIELLRAKRMNAQLEELAGLNEEPEKISAAKRPEGRKKGRQQPEPQAVKSQPIGALPETPDKHPRGLFSELVEDGRKYAEMLVGSVRDFRTASSHLIRLPLEAATLVARRLQPKKV